MVLLCLEIKFRKGAHLISSLDVVKRHVFPATLSVQCCSAPDVPLRQGYAPLLQVPKLRQRLELFSRRKGVAIVRLFFKFIE